MIRPSGTEPLVRMYGESTSRTLLDSKVREYTRIIESVLNKIEKISKPNKSVENVESK